MPKTKFGRGTAANQLSFYRKVKIGHARAFNLVELIGELSTSAFAGVITFWLCEAAEISPLATAALVGIAGHMGSRALYQFENWAEARFAVRVRGDE